MLMGKAKRLRILGALAITGALVLPTGSVMAAAPTAQPYTCGGGSVPGGTYSTLTITGMCDVVADATITVNGSLSVAPGAFFDAQSSPSTITVGGSVSAGQDSILGLGCQPYSPSYNTSTGHPCANDPTGHSVILVKGNLATTNASLVALNGITVNGNVALNGNGSTDLPPFIEGNDWSVKNNTIGGNLSASGIAVDWIGFMRNHVRKNVSLTNLTSGDAGDPSPYRAVYVVNNTIGWNLSCTNLSPYAFGGFNPNLHNIVGGNTSGQCVGL